jgi:hypothetical protein
MQRISRSFPLLAATIISSAAHGQQRGTHGRQPGTEVPVQINGVPKQISVWLVLRASGVFLGCMLGADALARLGTLRLTWFDIGELLAAIASIVALVPVSYRARVGGVTVAVAAVVGVARTLNVEAHALLEGNAAPIQRDGYVVQAVIYGTYILLHVWARRIAKGGTTTSSEMK